MEELVQLSLQPHDLIWIEGRSAGWSYPADIAALKPFVSPQKESATLRKITEDNPETKSETSGIPLKKQTLNATHIYVSLPAGIQTRTTDEQAPVENLEAKAEALYQRIQAFSEGHAEAVKETDTRYARSLDAMQQEYGAWLLQQKKKKKNSATKKKLLAAASVLIITTTGFTVTKWIQSKPPTPQQPLAGYALQSVTHDDTKQVSTVSFKTVSDTFTTTSTGSALFLKTDTSAKTTGTVKTFVKPTATSKKKLITKQRQAVPPAADTTATAALPVAEKPVVRQEIKKVIPLSRLLSVTGTLPDGKRGTANTTEITLHNNSSELLKSVAVTITYLKKEVRELNRETVHFYNVQPGSIAVLTASGNRRATSVRFDIGTITRADGSLYLIH
ncbi:MAG TPA: hypothetical protein VM187_14735 [Niastella sp.]|nr:hypothetical protein [Niastella sp.]